MKTRLQPERSIMELTESLMTATNSKLIFQILSIVEPKKYKCKYHILNNASYDAIFHSIIEMQNLYLNSDSNSNKSALGLNTTC